jgi:hypothetical protein
MVSLQLSPILNQRDYGTLIGFLGLNILNSEIRATSLSQVEQINRLNQVE